MTDSDTSNKKMRFSLDKTSSPKPTFQRKNAPRPSYNTSMKRNIAFGDDDSDSDDQDGTIELVTGFEDNQAKELNPKPKAEPLAIPALPNTDWRSKRQLYKPGSKPTETTQQAPEILTQQASSFGLQVPSHRSEEKTTTEETVESSTPAESPQTNDKPKTLEQEALEAIIQDASSSANGKEDTKLIIPNETEAFRNDVKNRPDEATMEDYERVPVEEFGAALLRGLGWKEGTGIGRSRKNAPAPEPIRQREPLLGLGATPADFDKDKKKSHKSRRSAYVMKDISLFKKVEKRKRDDDRDRDRRK